MGRRFRWRFETVKQAKEREEDRHKERLADAQRALTAEQESLDSLRGQREEQRRRMRESQNGKLDTAKLAAANRYIESLGQKIQAQSKKVESARRAAEARREELVKSVQENRVLERLRDRDHTEFRRDERRKDQAAMDETANRRSARNRRDP